MKIRNTTCINEGYAKIILTGKMDFRDCKSFIHTLIDNHISMKDLPIFIDMQGVEFDINLFEIFGIVKYVTSFQYKPLKKIYIVVSDGRSLVMGRFLQECLSSRGVDIRVSSRMAEINEWLSHSVCQE